MTNNKFIYDYNNLLSDTIGDQNGITKDEILDFNSKIDDIFNATFFNDAPEYKSIFENLETIDVQQIKELASQIRASCDNFVVLGIGGSALGSSAIFQALSVPNYNYLPKEKRNGPRFYVIDSIAPASFLGLINILDLSQTIFCVVSKSGKTTETMTQFFYVRRLCEEQFGDKWREHFVVLTDNTDNFLNNYAQKEGLRKLFIPTHLGGRYSVLSAVGLLPSAVLGYNIDALLDGARAMLECGRNRNIFDNAPLLSAICNFINYKKGKNMYVMIPYSDTLKVFDDWFCQLWGESIGRDKDAKGNDLFGEKRVGQTPIQVTGPSVQHSQFQLYLEGPDDKSFTFLGIKEYKIDAPLPIELNEIFNKEVAQNKTFGDLLSIERFASTFALKEYKKPSETITVDALNEQTMGKLFMFFMLKMVFTGVLLDICPFGQPAVESIKKEVARILSNDMISSFDSEIII